MFLPDTTERRTLPELMDAPDLEPHRHASALTALARVNALSGTAARVVSHLRRLGGVDGRALRVLDVACGGGDVALAVARHFTRAGQAVEVDGCDISPFAVSRATELAHAQGISARFFEWDVLSQPLPQGYDLVTSSLFLHHLSDQEAVGLLRRMATVGRALLVQDLVRSRLGYALAFAALRVLSRSDVAQTDGPRSVLGAFSLAEVADLSKQAGLKEALIRRCWPQRWELSWRAP